MNRLHTFALALMLTAATGATLGADIIEQILVRVNGEIITKSDLEQRQVAALRQRPDVQGLRGDDAALAKLLSDVTPQVIVEAVDELLLLQRGKELGYVMGDEQFQNILENIRKENKIESDEQFQQALQQEGMTMLDLRRQLEKQMLVSRVQQAEVMGKISVTDEEVGSYYDQHKNEFATTPQVTLREILVTVAGTVDAVNVAADEAARAKAEEIRTRLLAGEPFPRLAADLSDAASKANGGLLGEIPWEDVSPELQRVLDAMKVGDVTEVLRTPRGYQILKIDARTDGSVKPLADARDAVSEKVFESKRREEFQRYLVKLRGQAIIEWKNDEIKKAWETGLAAPPTAEGRAGTPGR
ncbi:MAG TPA: peptidyl-prolyl cis-trans isomerase [Vicinamibacterales bacterium]|nr:peptidyl-prolyl cis-trans isomerase [Vicinamibacterales bacterium]